MADSLDGEGFTFSTWQLYPPLHDYDRSWHADGTAMLKLLEDRCFLFFDWFMSGKWPSLAEAKVNYHTPIVAGDAPLKTTAGW